MAIDGLRWTVDIFGAKFTFLYQSTSWYQTLQWPSTYLTFRTLIPLASRNPSREAIFIVNRIKNKILCFGKIIGQFLAPFG
jgi:hypothetical protein